jgi:MFS family permease
MLIGVAVQTAATSVGMFIGCRFLIGFGLSFAGLASPLLIGELAFPTHRGTAVSLYGVNWGLGSIVAAWVTFGTFRISNTWSWRIPSLLQGVPTLIQLAGVYFIPESPRWLVSKGRDQEALEIIARYHCGGVVDDPLVTFEYQEIKEALHLEREAKESSTYRSLFSTPGNRKRMLVVIAVAFFSQWSGNGLVSYYLNLVLNGVGIKSTAQQTLFNGILQVYNYATSILGAVLVDRAGRRTLFLVSTGGMCLSYVVWTVCSAVYSKSAGNLDSAGTPITANVAAGHAVLAFIFIYYGGLSHSFSRSR